MNWNLPLSHEHIFTSEGGIEALASAGASSYFWLFALLEFAAVGCWRWLSTSVDNTCKGDYLVTPV